MFVSITVCIHPYLALTPTRSSTRSGSPLKHPEFCFEAREGLYCLHRLTFWVQRGQIVGPSQARLEGGLLVGNPQEFGETNARIRPSCGFR